MGLRNRLYKKFILLKARFRFSPFYTLHDIKLRTSYLSNTMKFYIFNGNYEEEDRLLCKKHLSPTDKVLEIGASIGFISLYCIKCIGIRDFCCVEPNPGAIAALKENFERNQAQLHLITACLAESDREITLYANNDLWACNTIREDVLKSPQQISVAGKQLKTLYALAPFKPDTLVVDAEGAEQYLNGDQIGDAIQKIIIELHPNLTGIHKAYKVLNELMNAGFEIIDRKKESFALVRRFTHKELMKMQQHTIEQNIHTPHEKTYQYHHSLLPPL